MPSLPCISDQQYWTGKGEPYMLPALKARPLDLSELDKRHHLHPLTNPVTLQKAGPDMVIRAEGIYIYTSDGKRLMDIGSGLHNVNIGYGNPRLCEAAFEAMQ